MVGRWDAIRIGTVRLRGDRSCADARKIRIVRGGLCALCVLHTRPDLRQVTLLGVLACAAPNSVNIAQ